LPAQVEAAAASELHFVRFRPPRLPPDGPGGEMAALPHIRLDRALQFLIGDRLA
jgi:predicted YcjX-like family ATPase